MSETNVVGGAAGQDLQGPPRLAPDEARARVRRMLRDDWRQLAWSVGVGLAGVAAITVFLGLAWGIGVAVFALGVMLWVLLRRHLPRRRRAREAERSDEAILACYRERLDEQVRTLRDLKGSYAPAVTLGLISAVTAAAFVTRWMRAEQVMFLDFWWPGLFGAEFLRFLWDRRRVRKELPRLERERAELRRRRCTPPAASE